MEALGWDTLVQIQTDFEDTNQYKFILGLVGGVVGITGSVWVRQRRNVEQDMNK